MLTRLSIRFSVAALATAFFALALRAQTPPTGSIQGRVQNAAAGLYLEHARVRIVGSSNETFTDKTGMYRFTNVPAGPVVLDVFYTGLTESQTPVTVTPGGTAVQDFQLMQPATEVTGKEGEKVLQLSQFVVAGERATNAAELAINEQRFAAGIEDVVSTDAYGDINQGNIGEFVKHMPGVNIEYKDGNNPSGIDVRGFGTNYTRVTVDGNMIASAAIGNTQTPNRQFVLEGASINDYSRIEVYKEPLPNMPANTMGGGVNLVSKSAFEFAKPEINFESYLSGNSNAFDIGKLGGVYRTKHREVVPSANGTIVLPLNDKLGVVVTAGDYDQFYNTYKSAPAHAYTVTDKSGNVLVNPANPYLNSTSFSISPNEVRSLNGSVKLDWKPSEGNILSVTAMATAYMQESGSHTLGFNTGSTGNSTSATASSLPVAWGPTFTDGTVGKGSASLGGTFQNRNALTRFIGANYHFYHGPWKGELAATYSNSNNRIRDIDKGFFDSVSTSSPVVKTIDFNGVDNGTASVGKITALDANGNPVDLTKIANYNMGTVNSQPATNNDSVTEYRGDLTRTFDTPWFPLDVSVGADTNNLVRDLKYTSVNWNYVGPNGNLSMAGLADPNYSGASPGFGQPGFEWPSPWMVYDLFKAHPEYFQMTDSQAAKTIVNNITRSPLPFERVSAGYVMLDAKFFHDRLRLVGGVRYELTQDRGYGYKEDTNAIYQKDANGNPIPDPNKPGSYLLLPQFVGTPSGGSVQTAAEYKYRGTYNSRDYHGYYKDGAVTFNITNDLLLRGAYAETVGRPSPSDIVPNIFVGANTTGTNPIGYISTSNTSLKPWTGKNYDLELQYYLPHNGEASVGVFRKDIKDFFVTTVIPQADHALLQSLGLGDEYLGYQFSTRTNGSDARIDGVELAYTQQLDYVPIVGRYFTFKGNMTKFSVTGTQSKSFDLKNGGGNIPLTGNLGLQFAYKRLGVDVEWNYRGEQFRDTSSAYPGAEEDVLPITDWDGDIEYRLTNHFSIFAAGRNLNNGVTRWSLDGPVAPQWSKLESYSTNGRQLSFGVRGAF